MRIAIHQPQYMAWVGYLHKMASVDRFVFLDDAQFKKNEWIHRNRIRNPEGWQWLSVPTRYRFPQAINQVEIDNTSSWRQKHLRSLEMCYRKARFYAEYESRVQQLFAETHTTIDTLNISSIRLLSELMGIVVPCVASSSLGIPTTATQRLVDICRKLGADSYLAGVGGHDYMDLNLFGAAGIEVVFQEFSPPVYKQHWAGAADEFIAGLSALDLLFNCGPESRGVLMGEVR